MASGNSSARTEIIRASEDRSGVRSHLLRSNEKLYRPTLVSIGPYHHNHPHLKPMDEHKVRALSQFLNRSKRSLNDLKASLRCDVGQLMNSYEELDEEWRDQEDKFLELMILDGCFLLEILRMMRFGSTDCYSQSDPVFGVRGRFTILNTLLNEIFMLENQVQYLDDIFVSFPKVHELYQVAGDKPMHLLDFGRTKIVGKLSPHKLPSFEVLETKTASTYKNSGIIFKTSQINTTLGFKLQELKFFRCLNGSMNTMKRAQGNGRGALGSGVLTLRNSTLRIPGLRSALCLQPYSS
ncbi:hypothetical protein H6P81_014761 [Aristolochia fimbriata]|uniref:Uncharacterized protein n=1 Tax=Aristolochia fimbriata TaxID=158543 RepID=A0AAV7E4V0_ARIFI|nr:hypothetical protein H6P81_014761 [Aristolochia fimbriata]